MKKILLILVFICCNVIVAQNSIQLRNMANNTQIQPNAIIYTVTPGASSNVKIYVDIKNVGATTNTYIAKRYDVHLNILIPDTDQAWAYFCFGGACFPPAGTTGIMVLRPNRSASDTTEQFYPMMADLDEATVVGMSHVKYTFFNKNNTSDSVQIQVRYNDPNAPAGLNNLGVANAGPDLYPNPTDETLTLDIGLANVVQSPLRLFNSIGEVVYSKDVHLAAGKNKLDVPIAELPPGVYFLSFKVGDANVTRKLVVK